MMSSKMMNPQMMNPQMMNPQMMNTVARPTTNHVWIILIMLLLFVMME